MSKSETITTTIMSWNINGIRAALKNGILFSLEKYQPQILCLQETKCDDKNFPIQLKNHKLYPYKYFNCSEKQSGYAGVALFCQENFQPENIQYGINDKNFDDEGRIITAYFEKFILVNAYVVNAGQGLKRLQYKREFSAKFQQFLNELNQQKPVIVCGDLNVAHKEIDLANPKTNLKTAGFTIEERQDFTKLLNEIPFIDTYRYLNPTEKNCYTYWGYRFNCRAKNIGWRLDYFLISEKLLDNLLDVEILNQIQGSDHCPIVLKMNNIF